jgi:phytoene dehydrogenase-like protein
MAAIVMGRMNHKYRNAFSRFKRAPGVFKVDYALREPVPWKASECKRAITVHVGGSFQDIAEAEKTVAQGREAERPFVLAAQPTLFDPSRAPEGKHVLWAYCHVPNGSHADMTERIEAQIERFAPGFRDCVLARHVSSPATMEKMNANLAGGDIAGGATTLRQILLRPTIHSYRTSARDIYLCSASTPPGGGVHGMCGYHAARLALRRMK